MKNGIYSVEDAWLDENEQLLLSSSTTYCAVLHGKNIEDENNLIDELFEAFEINDEPQYCDYLTCIELLEDLLWIKKPQIVLVVRDFDSMLLDNQNLKDRFLSDLENVVQWWTKDVVGHMVAGYPRSFRVFIGRNNGEYQKLWN